MQFLSYSQQHNKSTMYKNKRQNTLSGTVWVIKIKLNVRQKVNTILHHYICTHIQLIPSEKLKTLMWCFAFREIALLAISVTCVSSASPGGTTSLPIYARNISSNGLQDTQDLGLKTPCLTLLLISESSC